MKPVFLVTTILLIYACNDKPAGAAVDNENDTTGLVATNGDATAQVESANKPAVAGADTSAYSSGARICYSNLKNRDTVLLTFTRQDSVIMGELTYRFFQKDRNSGTVKGIIKGDTIIADYQFNAEGMSSVRQVVFLKRGNALIEGFGDVEEDKGRMVFRDVSSLVFDSSMVLNMTDCTKLPLNRR